MSEYHGTIVEQSLTNKDVLNELIILRTYTAGDWMLYDVGIDESSIKTIQSAMSDDPWYMNFWNDSKIVCVFKNKTFKMERSDKNTWKDAINYGIAIGIPKEQLDFVIPE